jgi:hypothetical protein
MSEPTSPQSISISNSIMERIGKLPTDSNQARQQPGSSARKRAKRTGQAAITVLLFPKGSWKSGRFAAWPGEEDSHLSRLSI